MASWDPLERISLLVESVWGLPNQRRFDRRGHTLVQRTPLEHIDYYSQALLTGALPDAETLLFVARALYKYVHSDGKLSLDEAFKLKSRQKAGNPVRRRIRENTLTRLLFSMALYRAHNPKPSIEKAAEVAVETAAEVGLEAPIPIPPETLEREYKRRGCKQWAEAFARSLQGK